MVEYRGHDLPCSVQIVDPGMLSHKIREKNNKKQSFEQSSGIVQSDLCLTLFENLRTLFIMKLA